MQLCLLYNSVSEHAAKETGGKGTEKFWKHKKDTPWHSVPLDLVHTRAHTCHGADGKVAVGYGKELPIRKIPGKNRKDTIANQHFTRLFKRLPS